MPKRTHKPIHSKIRGPFPYVSPDAEKRWAARQTADPTRYFGDSKYPFNRLLVKQCFTVDKVEGERDRENRSLSHCVQHKNGYGPRKFVLIEHHNCWEIARME